MTTYRAFCYNPSMTSASKKYRDVKLTPFAERGLFNVETAAWLLDLSPEHLRRLCRAKKISHTRRGSQYFFTQANIDGFFYRVEARP